MVKGCLFFLCNETKLNDMKRQYVLIPILGLLLSCAGGTKEEEPEVSQEQIEAVEESTQTLDESMKASDAEMEESQNEIDSLLNDI